MPSPTNLDRLQRRSSLSDTRNPASPLLFRRKSGPRIRAVESLTAPIHHQTPLLETMTVPKAKGGDVSTQAQWSQVHCSTELERLLRCRAVEAVVWGMPLVRFDVMRQAFFRDAKAAYGDIVYWSKPADWKVQFTTPDAVSYHVYFNFNTKAGPVVIDLPPSAAASLAGSIVSAWDKPLAEIGSNGVEKGRGGKLLLMPPSCKMVVPAGYIPVRSETYNGCALLRATADPLITDTTSALDLVRSIQVYPLAQASNPRQQRFIDMAGKLFDGVMRFDDRLFDGLARMVSEEPVRTRDLVAMNQIYPLGIGKRRTFEPDRATREILKESAQEVQSGLSEGSVTGEPLEPMGHWIRSATIPSKIGLTYETAARFGIDARNVEYFMAFEDLKERHSLSPDAGAFCDAARQPLQGERTYRLRIPARVAVERSWEVAAYDFDTASFIRQSPSVAVYSNSEATRRKGDGGVDVYFGPSAPSYETNWIYTAPGKRWFTFFRSYDPEKSFFDQTRGLPGLEKIG